MLINIQSALNSKIDHLPRNKDPQCDEFTQGNKSNILDEEIEDSKKSNATLFIFFSNKKDNYEKLKTLAGLCNKLLDQELKIDFFCENKTTSKNVTIDSSKDERDNMLEYYAVRNGTIVKEKKMNKSTPYFLEYMFNEFNLTEHLENKYPESDYKINATNTQKAQMTSFIQSAISLKNSGKTLQSDGTTIPLINISDLPKNNDTNIKEKTIDNEEEIKLRNYKNFEKHYKTNLKKDSLYKTIEETERKIHNKTNALMKKNSTENVKHNNKKNENNLKKKNKEKRNKRMEAKKDQSVKENKANDTSFLEKQSITKLDVVENSRLSVGNEYTLNLLQTKIEFNPIDYLTSEYLELSEQATNRLSRFLLAFFIVLISSLLCFLLVKYSIDWATKSRSELNSIKDRENREILEEINRTHNLIRFN